MSCSGLVVDASHHHHHLDATVSELHVWYANLVSRFGLVVIDHCQHNAGHKLAALSYGIDLLRLHKAIERKVHHISKCHDKLAHHDMKILHKRVDCLLKAALVHFVLDIKEIASHISAEPEQVVSAVRSARSSLRSAVAEAREARASAAYRAASRSPSPVGRRSFDNLFVPED